MNELAIELRSGSDIYQIVNGIDPKTSLKYRFDDFSDITMHISAMFRDDPYLSKPLTVSTDDNRDLIIELTEDEILNKDGKLDNYQMVSVPNTFYFYVNAKDQEGRRVILLSGIITYKKFSTMRFF